MRKNIYLSIIEAIKLILDDSGERVIQYFNLWNEDVTFAEEVIFPTPAVFIEFEPITYKAIKEPTQRAQVGIKLHIVTQAVHSSADGEIYQEQSLMFLDLIDKINKSLYDLKGVNFSNMVRTGSYTNHDHGELMENIETYTCSAGDFSALKKE